MSNSQFFLLIVNLTLLICFIISPPVDPNKKKEGEHPKEGVDGNNDENNPVNHHFKSKS